jgi:hypothetical protein
MSTNKNNKSSRLIRAANMGYNTTQVLYHGTAISGHLKSTDIKAFDPKKIGDRFSLDNKGFFFNTSTDIVNTYAESDNDFHENGSGEGAVYPVYLKMKKPLLIDGSFLENENMEKIGNRESTITFWDNYQYLIMEWFSEGTYDGIILRDSVNTNSDGSPIETHVVFKPEHIKSIHAYFLKGFDKSPMLHEQDDRRFIVKAEINNNKNYQSEFSLAI